MKEHITEIILPHGGKGILVNIPKCSAVKCLTSFRAGHLYTPDYPSKEQVAHVMEHMAFDANKGYAQKEDYDEDFTRNGASYNASTGDIFIEYNFICAKNEWKHILELNQLAIANPIYTERSLKESLDTVYAEMSRHVGKPVADLLDTISNLVGSPHLAFSKKVDTIRPITLDDIKKHHEKTHTRNNMVFMIVGDLEDQIDELTKTLDQIDLPLGELLPMPKDWEAKGPTTKVIECKSYKDYEVAIRMVIDKNWDADDYRVYAMDLLNKILFNTSSKSRIWAPARKRGLVYAVGGGKIQTYRKETWWIQFKVATDKIDDMIDLIVAELQNVRNGKITDKEIELAKSNWIGKYDIAKSKGMAFADSIYDLYLDSGRILDDSKAVEAVRAITKDQIIDTAREFLQSPHWVAVIQGPKDKELEKRLHKKLSKVLGIKH